MLEEVDGSECSVMVDKVKVGSQALSWRQFVTSCVSYWMLAIHNFDMTFNSDDIVRPLPLYSTLYWTSFSSYLSW